MINHSKVMLLGLLPIIALSTLLICGTVQQKSALVFGAEDKSAHFYEVDKNAHFYDVFITTENGVEKFAADYRKITGDDPSDTKVIKNTQPRTAPNIVLKEGKSTEIHFDCKNDDCLTNLFDRFNAKLVPLGTSDKTIVTGKPHVVKTIVDNHPCNGIDEACSYTFNFPSENLKPGHYLLVVEASVDEFTGIFINEVKVIKTQSYADRDNDDHKKGEDLVSSIIASSESDKKSASQHQDQDNFCYRDDDCEQANQGQQIVGKDNDVVGFNDQSENLALFTLGAGIGNATGNGN